MKDLEKVYIVKKESKTKFEEDFIKLNDGKAIFTTYKTFWGRRVKTPDRCSSIKKEFLTLESAKKAIIDDESRSLYYYQIMEVYK